MRSPRAWARPGRARATAADGFGEELTRRPSFRRSARYACVVAGARATGACGENDGQHTRPHSPMRWSRYITNSPVRGAIAAAAATLAALPAAPASGATKADPVRTTIDRALTAGRIDAEQHAGYVASYSGARRTLKGLSGQRKAELGYVLDTLRSFARQKRLTARLRPHVPDPGPQPGVVGEGRTAGIRSTADVRRKPGDLPVLPREGASDPSAGQLRPPERLLAGAQELGPALAWHRTS